MGLFPKKGCSLVLGSPFRSLLESVYPAAVSSNWQFWQTTRRALQRHETHLSTWEGPFVVDRNICHFFWYGGVAGDGLRSVGVEPPPLIQERVLYPAHRSPFIGPGRSSFGPSLTLIHHLPRR